MFDVAIIGAGPAGSTLARLIGQTHRVLLVDKRPMTEDNATCGPRRCCGGLLAPDGQKMLSRFGLGLPKSVLVDPQLFVVRAIDIPNRQERYYQRFYVNMDRQRFDRWLVSLVPGGVDIRLDCRLKSFDRVDGRFVLDFISAGRRFQETARILVGADGAASHVRNLIPEARRPWRQTYLAIQEWMEVDAAPPYFSAIFDPEITDYYCWTIPKENHLLIGAALRPKDAAPEKFARLKEKLKAWGFHWGKTVRREGSLLARPSGMKEVCTGDQGIALVGEAAGWISPSSAEGISYAFRSALALAEALHQSPHDFLRQYRQNTRSLAANVLIKGLKSQVIFHPAVRRTVMQLGLQSVDIAFPDA